MKSDTVNLQWSEVAEQSVLGAALIQPDALARIANRRLSAMHFYSNSHRAIWGALTKLTAARQPIDVVTAFQILREDGLDASCGGLMYLNQLSQSVPSAANIERYADIVLDKALSRDLATTLDRALEIAAGPGDSNSKLDAVATLMGTLQRPGSNADPKPISELVSDRIAHWECQADGTVSLGLSTGIPTLDRALGGGLRPGRVMVIAARPSVGKTSLATQIALNASRAGGRVLFFSQEMQSGELVDRAVANLGRVSLEAVSTGCPKHEDSHRLADGAEQLGKLKISVDDTPGLSLHDIRHKARISSTRYGLDLLVLDYLQLTRDDGRQQSRHHQIEQISRGLKVLSKEMNCAVIVLSQLNRQSTQRADGEPSLSDLKESGAIEEDADTCILLHPLDKASDGEMPIKAILAKNRQGRRGFITLKFHGATQVWREDPTAVDASLPSRKSGR